MKTKLNIYCLLIFAVIATDLMLSANVIVAGLSEGQHRTERTGGGKAAPTGRYHVVSLMPSGQTDSNAITITDKATGKTYKAWPTELNIPAGGDKGGQGSTLSGVMLLASLTLGIMAVAAFIRFVLNVNRSRIFTGMNTRFLKCIGWCMLTAGILNTIVYSADEYCAVQTFSLTGYTPEYLSAAYIGTMLSGLFSLVMAEAFAIGVKMKEEQDLTV